MAHHLQSICAMLELTKFSLIPDWRGIKKLYFYQGRIEGKTEKPNSTL